MILTAPANFWTEPRSSECLSIYASIREAALVDLIEAPCPSPNEMMAVLGGWIDILRGCRLELRRRAVLKDEGECGISL